MAIGGKALQLPWQLVAVARQDAGVAAVARGLFGGATVSARWQRWQGAVGRKGCGRDEGCDRVVVLVATVGRKDVGGGRDREEG